MYELSSVHGIEKLKNELEVEKYIHDSAQAKNVILLSKANKWESKAIGKEKKLSLSISELNSNAR